LKVIFGAITLASRVIKPSSDRPLLNDTGAPSSQFDFWLRAITEQALIIGTGNPEGVYEALQGARYMDENGTAGNILYIKRNSDILGDKTKGWILV
jgi:hypothetical protein